MFNINCSYIVPVIYFDSHNRKKERKKLKVVMKLENICDVSDVVNLKEISLIDPLVL